MISRFSRCIALATLLAAWGLGSATTASAQQLQLTSYLGTATFASSLEFQNTTVGGLSGLTYDRANNVFYAISDDRSQTAPTGQTPAARFYSLGINLSSGTLSNSSVQFQSVSLLRQPNGSTFPTFATDTEGIALSPTGTLFISSEGDRNRPSTANPTQPFINEFTKSGNQIAALPIPTKFQIAPGSGVNNNLAFESLTVTPSGNKLFTATESALLQDGSVGTLTSGSPCRILSYDLTTGTPGAEYLYYSEAIPRAPNPAGSAADNGLADLLAVNDTTFIALERAFANGVGNTIRLYEISLDGATDISGINSLTANGMVSIQAVNKRLLLTVNDFTTPDNIEGLTFGPDLGNGIRSLILVSDSNFGSTQVTQFVGFGVSVVPEPGVTSVLLAGLVTGGIFLKRRVRRG